MTVMQLAVPDGLRGRVMGIHSICFGLIPLGGLLGGAVASVTSPPFAAALNASLLAGIVALAAVTQPGSGRGAGTGDSGKALPGALKLRRHDRVRRGWLPMSDVCKDCSMDRAISMQGRRTARAPGTTAQEGDPDVRKELAGMRRRCVRGRERSGRRRERSSTSTTGPTTSSEDTISNFEERTGIKVNYDVFDSNEVLEAKLLARQQRLRHRGPDRELHGAPDPGGRLRQARQGQARELRQSRRGDPRAGSRARPRQRALHSLHVGNDRLRVQRRQGRGGHARRTGR